MSGAVFITGAASGIGLETARRLAADGWTLGLADLDLERLTAATAELSGDVARYAMDVTDPGQIEAALTDFMARTGGRLRGLVQSAGVLRVDPFDAIEHGAHQTMVDVNLMGLVNVAQAALPYLKATPGAVMVQMSSASATYGVPQFAVYSATKAAVRALTEALELEWAPHGVRVCDVMPPFVSTPMLNDQRTQAPVIRRMGVDLEAADVAAVIVKQLRRPKLHRPVGLQFAVLHTLSDWLPRSVSRFMMKVLSRP